MKTLALKKYPRITIVTPSFNQGGFLSETIESILNQDYPNLEYIVIDGGSTDESLDIIKRYEDQLSYWCSEKDRGQSDAIMKGFNRATGELFAWVNSDDVLLSSCLSVIADCYLREKEPDIVTGNVVYIDDQGCITRYIRLPRQSRFFFFRGIWHASAPAIFFKASLFKEIGGLNLDYHLCMDLDMWMQMMKRGARVVHIPRYLGAYRWHKGAKTVQYLTSKTTSLSQERVYILKENIPRFSVHKVLFWRTIYKLYQAINFNYLRGYLSCHPVKGTEWWRMFGSGPSKCS